MNEKQTKNPSIFTRRNFGKFFVIAFWICLLLAMNIPTDFREYIHDLVYLLMHDHFN